MDSPAAELIRSARRHEPGAWNALLRHHQLPLYTYVAELLHDEAAALDVVQETFAAAVRHIDTLRDDARFGSWLFGIAHQKCVQQWRRRQREDALFDASPLDPAEAAAVDHEAPDPRVVLMQQEQANEFFNLVEQLPDSQRSALLLHVLEDFSLEEIARITDVPVGTVKSRLFHAKRALRALMEVKK